MVLLTAKKENKKDLFGGLDPNYWIQKSDPLMMMRSVPFSLGELKILDTYISRINASDYSRDTVIFTKEDYEKLLGLSNVDSRTLRKNTRGMLGKVVELYMPNGDYMQFVLFDQAVYRKDEFGRPIIELTCSRRARELFFCVNNYHYFKYALGNVVNLNSKHSYLLYLYIVANRFRKEWLVDLSMLRDNILDLRENSSYKEYKIFKRAVLEKAVTELNEKTDCKFDYEPVRLGRTVAKIKFIYHSKIPADLMDDSWESLSLNENNEVEIDYGSELSNYLGHDACDDEFSPAQIRVLQDLINKIPFINEDDQEEMYDYLRHKIHLLNYYDQEKTKSGNVLNDRFAYLRSMIEKELADCINIKL